MAVVMVLVNHYFAFSHFGEKYYPFSEVTNVDMILTFNSDFYPLVLLGDGLLHPLYVARAVCILRVPLC